MSITLKIQVVTAFLFRLPLLVFTAFHLSYFTTYPSSQEPLFSATNPLLFMQVMLAWSLLSATIPNLKAFMKSFSVGFGVTLGAFDSSAYDSRGNTYPMDSMKSQVDRDYAPATRFPSKAHDGQHFRSKYGRGSPEETELGDLRPDHSRHQTAIYHQDRSSGTTQDKNSITSAGSQELIIKREVQWNVYHEPPNDGDPNSRFY